MNKLNNIPDSTAVRVALWRAMHVQLDDKPHILEDEIGIQLIAPEDGWRNRPDMHPIGTKPFRASIVARSRFVEDALINKVNLGVDQYVLLGAGLDTFAQRQTKIASKIKIFEIDKISTQEWKKDRLSQLGYLISPNLNFVSVDFELKQSWFDLLVSAGFDTKKTSFLTSLGVSMYLTHEAIIETFEQIKRLAPGSTFIMTFMLPLELVDSQDKFGYEMAIKGAKASGTPFISFFSPNEIVSLANSIGFQFVSHTSIKDLSKTYFSNRTDGLLPSSGEELLIVNV